MTQAKPRADGGAPGAPDAALDRSVLTGTDPGLPSWSLLLTEIGGYAGGVFVSGAAAILLADTWHGMATAVRCAALAVPALLLLAAGVVTARSAPGGWHPSPERYPAPGGGARRRLVSLLATAAAVLAGGSAAVLVQAGEVNGDWTAFAWSWTAAAVLGPAYALCRAELLHVVLGLGVATSVLASVRVLGWYAETSTGWAFVAVGVGWALATLTGLLTERGLGFGWAGVLVFVGAELLTATGVPATGYGVLGALVVAGLAGFTRGRSLTLLVIGVATLAVLVPQLVVDLRDGALGASWALLLVSLSIVGASALGFRLHRAPVR